MTQLRDFIGSVAVVVSSCDAFFDAWRPFAFFFRKHWSDCPFPVYLIVNELTFRSEILRPLAVGPDRGWATNMKLALQQLPAPRVLYLQEDYFLTEPVRQEQLAHDFSYAFEHDADAFCFRARSELEPTFHPINDRFGVVPRDSDGRTRCQLTLWKRDALLAVLRDGENAWEMESRGSERTRDMLALSYSTREQAPVPYLMSAIVRGLWTPEALRLCAANQVKIAPHFRGTYTQSALLRRWRRARTRQRLGRELARVRSGILDLDRE
jgi:hypothetical protein